MDLNRHHLAVAHAVAQMGNISAAAQLLGITQPAVSRQLAQLETAIGLKLFDRSRSGVTPTAAGRLLHAHTTGIEAMLDRLAESLEDFKSKRVGTLRIGASSTIGIYLVPNLLRRYEALFPKVQTQIVIGNTLEIETDVANGVLDFGLVEGVIQSDRLHTEVFAEDELLAIAPAQHSWAGQKTITPQAFLKERYIAREPGSGTRDVIAQAFVAGGLNITPSMTVRGSGAVKAFVAAGHGVSILSALAVAEEVESGRFIARLIRGLRLRRNLHLVRPIHKSLSPSALAAVQLIFGRLPRQKLSGQK
jgi:DNA-binding transcriptional LysR family regulator